MARHELIVKMNIVVFVLMDISIVLGEAGVESCCQPQERLAAHQIPVLVSTILIVALFIDCKSSVI